MGKGQLSIAFKDAYVPRMGPGWGGPFMMNQLNLSRAEFQVPGDIEQTSAIGQNRPPHGRFQTGRLKEVYTVTFPDHSQIVFPVNSPIEIWWNEDGETVKGMTALTDADGMPIPPHVDPWAAHGGGRRQRRRSHRHCKTRRQTRRLRYSRRR